MFPTLGLFQKIPCPERHKCKRQSCIFNHDPNIQHPPTVHIPVGDSTDATSSGSKSTLQVGDDANLGSVSRPSARPATKTQPPNPPSTLAKRGISSSVSSDFTPPKLFPNTVARDTSGEPPRKLQRVGPATASLSVTTAAALSSGPPVLRVSAAQSQVPLPVRQTMLKSLYDHFEVLYENILLQNPTIASEHALKQEEEVYKRTTKLTYRNAVISSIATLKRRVRPDSISHPSVGTEGEIAAREEQRKKLESLKLTPSHLEPYVLSMEEMGTWGYITEIPPGEGGSQPTEEGNVKNCDRCREPFQVKRKDEADECVHHWGKRLMSKHNGERKRVWSCCSKFEEEDGCSRGPHVFYENHPEDLHRRHAFSHTRPARSLGPGSSQETALDAVALDCEMIYTTGGMRVARVSVVDSAGKEIYDELVRMDEGVEVIDFNTRFSGITEEGYAGAVLPLSSTRSSLDALINSNTIIIGHALENDLKTLRMIHHRCVDTAIMFPHKSGPPYRRSLRDLVKEHLGKTIQSGGGSTGHSSVEDSIATLDLVRWRTLNGPPPKPKKPHVAKPSLDEDIR